VRRTTGFRGAPIRDGDKAGLVAFRNEDRYYFLSLPQESGRTVARLEMQARKCSNL
jgi:hypothetical protein